MSSDIQLSSVWVNNSIYFFTQQHILNCCQFIVVYRPLTFIAARSDPNLYCCHMQEGNNAEPISPSEQEWKMKINPWSTRRYKSSVIQLQNNNEEHHKINGLQAFHSPTDKNIYTHYIHFHFSSRLHLMYSVRNLGQILTSQQSNRKQRSHHRKHDFEVTNAIKKLTPVVNLLSVYFWHRQKL